MPRPKKKPSGQPQELPLARELFPELNATFYTGDPAEFLRLRIESLSLMTLSAEQLAPMLGVERRVGTLSIAPTAPPTDDVRDSYIATEAIMIFHHAAEMLLRLFYAHVEKADCPWLGMTSSTNFAEFKNKVARSRDDGFSEADIALAFLGGTDPRDAALAASDEEFSETVGAIGRLLGYAADRFLRESFLYNAAKHGLTTVRVEAGQITMDMDDTKVPIHDGDLIAYLHGPAAPDAPKGGRKGHLSMTSPLPDADLAAATMIYHAVVDLWQVARRRYTGEPGRIVLFSRDDVQACIAKPVLASKGMARTTVMELTKRRPDGSLTGIEIDVHATRVTDTAEKDHRPAMRAVELPTRQRDKKIYNPSGRWLLPISPAESSRV